MRTAAQIVKPNEELKSTEIWDFSSLQAFIVVDTLDRHFPSEKKSCLEENK